MKAYTVIGLCVVMCYLFSCGTQRPVYKEKDGSYKAPPGTIRISPGLYIDETEITNTSYLEFYWWMRRVYGDSSAKFKEIIPQQANWYDMGSSYAALAEHYFTHPAYWFYPVVNITYRQATLFCQWRSDRVMEYYLIMSKVIEHVPNPHRDSVFTIVRYFTGQYKGLKPDTSLYYPWYDLPDSSAFKQALIVSDSLWMVNDSRIRKRGGCYQTVAGTRCYETLTYKNDTMMYGPDPMLPAYCPGSKRKINVITHLLGNVREMTNVQDLSFGGSYKDSCSIANYFQKEAGANCYTGFRCMCRYKKWQAVNDAPR